MGIKLSNLGEFGLINRIRHQTLLSKDTIKGIGDDAAVTRWMSGKQLLLTTDMIVEGIHFTRKMPFKAIGHKALACNISDIAAMGGVPKFAVVSLGVSGQVPTRWIDQIYEGIFALAKKFKVDIVGGDTVKSSKIIINIALIGEATKSDLVFRSGAKVGDQIFVTGKLGASLKSGHHLNFVPRLEASQFLVKNFKPSAMIDLSDGLAADLGHILEESKVGAEIWAKEIPRRDKASIKQALYDGEDFELLFTLPKKKSADLISRAPFDVYAIGEITTQKEKIVLVDHSGKRKYIPLKGFKHF